ncbi:MAG TPA: FtsX-like permease family protein [Flavipsychrobacter sp.]|nr:FtsX-like permease family protein [Flavipsychrobacter sp.]
MLLIFQLAWRYLRGKRGANIVPILSRISMVAIGVGSCAMIVLFSIFNGFEHLIKDLYKAFYPELKITVAKGKFFALESEKFEGLQKISGITAITKVIEDNVLLNAHDEQQVATLKGIERNYQKVNHLKPYIYKGADSVLESPIPTAIIGLQTANHLGIEINNVFSRLSIYYPNAAENLALNPQSAFQNLQLQPEGIFRIQDEFDSKYILAPIKQVQELFLQPGKYSSIEIAVTNGTNHEKVKQQLQQLLGKNYVVATRYEQNKTLYMVMKTEKWAVYGILVLVLLIASFNMVGALTLLVLEKQKDIAILKAMGAQNKTIRGVFISEGVLWAAMGGGIGVIFGALFCLGQEKFHWIKLQGAFIIESYPVAMQWSDFVLVGITVVIVGLLASWYPAMRATQAKDPSLKST